MERSDSQITINAQDCDRFIVERGSHRIQRVPITERRGRVHTSIITVSVLFAEKQITLFDKISDNDFEVRFHRGSGKGGQRRNKVASCCVVTHIASGLTQKSDGRSRIDNELDAKNRLKSILREKAKASFHEETNIERIDQIGTGQRGDNKRTYRFQEDMIIDHETGKQTTCKRFMRGNISDLW